MANAGQDDVDRALAAAGVPAMRYFNFRNLRFVRGPATDPVETFGVNADDHDLHVIRPPGTDAPDASPKHQPHFGYDPVPADVPHIAPLEPDPSEAAALDAEPAHAIEEPEPVVPPPAPEPPVVTTVEPPAAEIPVVPPRITAPPVVAEIEPPPAPAEIPVVPPRVAEPPPVASAAPLPPPEAVSPAPAPPVLPVVEVPPPIAVPPPPEPEPPVVAKQIEPPPPAPEPPPVPRAEAEPQPAPAALPAPVLPREVAPVARVEPPPPPVANVEPPPPPPPLPRPPVREPPTVKVVETEAPVFDLEPAPPVAAPVAAAAPAEAGPVFASVERESLSQMFTALADRAEPRPRAATWGTPEAPAEAPPDTPAPVAEPPREPAPAAAKPVPEFRMSDVRYTERAPVPPSRAVAEPKQGEPAVFSLAERLAARPDAPPPSRADGQRAATQTVTAAPPRARAIPSPFQRPAPAPGASEPPTAEALFRRL